MQEESKKHNAKTVTTTLRGAFDTDSTLKMAFHDAGRKIRKRREAKWQKPKQGRCCIQRWTRQHNMPFLGKEEYDEVIALSFNYGQRHSKELECAKKICKEHGVEHHILDMGLLNQLAPNSLTRVDMEVDHEAPEEGTPNSFVDGRNMLFLTFAAVFAKQRDIHVLVTGVSQSDFSGYPDSAMSLFYIFRNNINTCHGL